MFLVKYFLSTLVILLIVVCTPLLATNEHDPIVETKYGKYIGKRLENDILAFEGVRYAKPPVGDLRFDPPVMIDTSDVEHIVKSPGSACIQWNLGKFEIGDLLEGEEDCLFLNIYVPAMKLDKKLPVIFHIHGGALTVGQGLYYGPDYLLKQQDMILVNINYRLGVLGFLSSGDKQIPGNMGFKDQALALKWVHENIESFGGDSNKIVLSGWSPGAASSHAHLFSPLSQNLFAGGISHSGCATSFWILTEKVKERYEFVKSEIGCNSSDEASVLACLKDKDAGDLIRSTQKLHKFMWFPALEFAMVVEPPSAHAFMVDTPLNLLKRGDYPTEKPWILSLTEAEGAGFTGAMVRDNEVSLLNELNNRWDELAPYVFNYHTIESEEKKLLISKKIREFYFKDQTISNETVNKLTKALTDRYWKHGVSIAAENRQKIHVYNFNFTVNPGFGAFLSNLEDASHLGVVHGDDLILIFSTPYRKGKPLTEAEIEMSNNLVEMYRSFAYTGELKYGTLAFRDDEQTSSPDGVKYIDIHNGNYGIRKTVPYEIFGDRAFWDSLEINDVL